MLLELWRPPPGLAVLNFTHLRLHINSRRRADSSTKTLTTGEILSLATFACLELTLALYGTHGTRAGLSGEFKNSPPFDEGLWTMIVFDSSRSGGLFCPRAEV